MDNEGLKMAIKYSIVPCQLGFCGPTDKSEQHALLKFLSRKPSKSTGREKDEEKIKSILKKFAGTNIYYNFIARSNNITDPFDKKVIEAYWLGNEFLEKLRGAAHHSFHVYKIGSITGRIKFTDKLQDLCRISWGKVKEINNDKITIEYQAIIRNKVSGKLGLGKPIKKIVDWNKAILPEVKIGDIISIHWNKAIEVLNDRQIANLIRFTLINIK